MAHSLPNPVDHPTHRLVGDAPAMAALRAQELLAAGYAWFTEGFETVDLQEA